MAILDIFKKKTEEKRSPKPKTRKKDKAEKKEKIESVKPVKKEIKDEVKDEVKKEGQKKEEHKKRPRKRELSEAAFHILRSPHITEKAIRLNEENKYVFRINKSANKTGVKGTIEELYGVRVLDINIVNIPRKRRRLGRSEGFKSGYKKAIVTLAEGEKIETGV